jgi:pSer/pThr/pTyr-binding forkhead associated (FHA) protein
VCGLPTAEMQPQVPATVVSPPVPAVPGAAAVPASAMGLGAASPVGGVAVPGAAAVPAPAVGLGAASSVGGVAVPAAPFGVSASLAPRPGAVLAERADVVDRHEPRVERHEQRTDNFGAVHPTAVTAQLVTILKDGSEGPVYRLTAPVTDIGRHEGNITLPDDPYLSSRHARIQRRNDRHYLRDLGSVNGIFQRIREPVELHHGDVVLVGQQVLRIEVLSDGEVSLGPVMHYGVMLFGTPEQPRLVRLVQLTSEGIPRDIYHLYRDETVIGRESGDVVFTDDVFLSRRHVAFRLDRAQRRVVVRDLGSSNGTLVLFRGERELVDGDIFRIGHHLFRFDAAPRGSIVGAGTAGASR